MIEELHINYEGPDGTYLVLEGDFKDEIGRHLAQDKPLILRVNDDLLRALDVALGAWREHQAEGEAIRQEYVTKSGRVLTDDDLQDLADEAARGYDVESLLEAADLARKQQKGE